MHLSPSLNIYSNFENSKSFISLIFKESNSKFSSQKTIKKLFFSKYPPYLRLNEKGIPVWWSLIHSINFILDVWLKLSKFSFISIIKYTLNTKVA